MADVMRRLWCCVVVKLDGCDETSVRVCVTVNGAGGTSGRPKAVRPILTKKQGALELALLPLMLALFATNLLLSLSQETNRTSI